MPDKNKFSDENVAIFYQEFLLFKDEMEKRMITVDGERKQLTSALEKNTQAIKAVSETITKAFPDGDVVGHRLIHEAQLKAKEAEEQFWRDLKLDLAKKGLWALLIFFTIAGLITVGIWERIKTFFH